MFSIEAVVSTAISFLEMFAVYNYSTNNTNHSIHPLYIGRNPYHEHGTLKELYRMFMPYILLHHCINFLLNHFYGDLLLYH